MTLRPKTLVITGSMGSGKTTMIGEVSDLLQRHHLAHAAIDIDAFGNAHDPAGGTDLAAIAYRNVAAAVRNYVDAGLSHFVLAGAIESRAELSKLRDAVNAIDIVVCRLTAPIAVMEHRVRMREPGLWQQKYVARVAELDGVLDAARVEDFSLANDGTRAITEVAEEIVKRVGWLAAP
jgi:adenylylsulfate kinase-like enzyme